MSEPEATDATPEPAQDTAAAETPEAPSTPAASAKGSDAGTLQLVLDVSVPVTVELGRTEMSIRDVLNLDVGSTIELDKLAGEPVDVFVRGIHIATGDVVVVGDDFGVRVKEILTPVSQAEAAEARA